MEALNLQMNLGAKEAKDEFERQKVSINKFIHEVNQKLDEYQDDGKEKLLKLKSNLEELRVQVALGKAEVEEELKEQHKKISRKLHEVKQESSKVYNEAEGNIKHVAGEVEDKMDDYHTRFDLFRLQLNLGMADARTTWEEKKKDLSYKLQEMTGKLERNMENAEDKFEDFGEEMKEAWHHVKKAFKS